MRRFFTLAFSTIFIGGAWIFTGVKIVLDTIGRAASFKDIGEEHGVTAQALAWIFSTPWYVPASLSLLATIGFLLLVYKVLAPARADAAFMQEAAKHYSMKTNFAVFDRSEIYPAEYRIRSNLTLRDVEIFVDRSTYFGGAGWSARKRIHIAHYDKINKDELVTGTLFGRAFGGPTVIWKIGKDGENVDTIARESVTRCRLVISQPSDKEEYFYFVIYMRSLEEGPRIIGEHMFAHMYEWQGLLPRIPETIKLFR